MKKFTLRFQCSSDEQAARMDREYPLTGDYSSLSLSPRLLLASSR